MMGKVMMVLKISVIQLVPYKAVAERGSKQPEVKVNFII